MNNNAKKNKTPITLTIMMVVWFEYSSELLELFIILKFVVKVV
jgi:hypothetical protein